jgi:molecular chaperone DnaK (HSP70)
LLLLSYSGVSWAVNEGQKKIRLITDWPTRSEAIGNQDKVPSTISYKNGRVANWGYEVNFREESFKWIKILLEPNSEYTPTVQEVRDSNELLRKLNKTAEEVIRDYLQEIWRYTKEDIRKRVGGDDWEKTLTIHIALTVPAMWSPLAKDKTLRVARDAGLPGNIKLVTEPEAAALATLHDKAEENSLAVCFYLNIR